MKRFAYTLVLKDGDVVYDESNEYDTEVWLADIILNGTDQQIYSEEIKLVRRIDTKDHTEIIYEGQAKDSSLQRLIVDTKIELESQLKSIKQTIDLF